MIFPVVNTITNDLNGLYRIDHAPYHAAIGHSSSNLKDALVSYGHFKAGKIGKEPTPAMAFGTAFHMALLEPELYAKSYAVMPGFDGHPNSNLYRLAKAEWIAENNGKTCIEKEKQCELEVMIDAVVSHPQWKLFNRYQPEIMGTMIHKETGLRIKCKMDLFGSAIVDVKTTQCAAAAKFRRSTLDFGYHTSAAFYQNLIREITGEKMRFIHLVVEKAPTYGVAFWEMSDDFLAEGEKLWRAGLQRIAEWEAMHEAPSLHYGGDIQTLQVTPQVLYRTKETLDEVIS